MSPRCSSVTHPLLEWPPLPQRGHSVEDNRSKGAARQIKGSAKELAGKLTGNTSKEIAGKIEKNVGKAQRNIGEAADEARDTKKVPRTKD